MKPNVKVKVLGDTEDVEQFLKIIENNFALMLKSSLLPNKGEEGVHCYVDIDPYALKQTKERARSERRAQ